jgi:hypothetical protein
VTPLAATLPTLLSPRPFSVVKVTVHDADLPHPKGQNDWSGVLPRHFGLRFASTELLLSNVKPYNSHCGSWQRRSIWYHPLPIQGPPSNTILFVTLLGIRFSRKHASGSSHLPQSQTRTVYITRWSPDGAPPGVKRYRGEILVANAGTTGIVRVREKGLA